MKTIEEMLDVKKISTTIRREELLRIAFIIGATHDTGKGTPLFQQYLPPNKIDTGILKSHAMIGSLYCSWLIRYDPLISEANRRFLALVGALVIQGHHGCLKSRAEYLKSLDYFEDNEIFRKQIESFKVTLQEMEAITVNDLGLGSFTEFCNNWEDHLFYFRTKIIPQKVSFEDKMEPYFIINSLYSALLDNDVMDAAELERPERLSIDENIVKSYIKDNLVETNEIDKLRNILFEYIDKHPIKTNDRLYTLTLPTGLGKTLDSMNFALRLRKQIEEEKGFRPRIIYVAPYISILDQNMEVFQKVFQPDSKHNTNLLLIHHHLAAINYHHELFKNEGYGTSQSELLIHGWNAEVVVTTFVQFFMTLFGRFTSQLRRLDNLMGSIVILDEVQSVPYELWSIIRTALLFLSKKFNFTIILMTATQPMIFRKDETVEIAATNKEVQALPPRVSFEVRTELPITLDGFCLEMNDLIARNPTKNLLIELNTIHTAKYCFDNIHSDTHSIRFLSSQVIPKSRIPRIKEIKESIADKNKKIVLVSTQVIEAGVDVDFDTAVRDIGPIDSIVQTAGRCNREGDRDASESPFYIYRIIDSRSKIEVEHAKYVYGTVAIDIAKSLLQNNNLDVNAYYNEIKRRRSKQRSGEIHTDIEELEYEKVERECRLLDEDMYKLPVFVELDEATRIWRRYVKLDEQNGNGKKRRTAEKMELRNQMGQYMIDVHENEIYLARIHDISGIYKINNNQIGILYDEEKGFVSPQ
jgi:CRISPR-associated endonuclease/helicase Cas3